MILNNSIFRNLEKEDKAALYEVMDLLDAVNNFLSKDPTLSKGYQYHCHSLSDAIAANMKGMTVVDGYYIGLKLVRSKRSIKKGHRFILRTCDHSWLLTKSGAIIDPYPPGTLNINPLIFPGRGKYKNYGHTFYVPHPAVGKRVRKRWLWKESARWKKIFHLARLAVKK